MSKDKLLEKANKVLGNDSTNELLNLPNDKLEALIVSAARDIEDAKAELDANPKYQELKQSKKDIEASLRDLRKVNNLKIQLAASVLTERGK